jgi:NAD(P)H-dependent nitrite reductase small subunit
MSDFTSVARVDDVPEGEGRRVQAGGIEIALFKIGDTFYAIDDTCIHQGGPLGDGICRDGVVTCPWHGWQYDIATGACHNSPSESVDTYEVRVENGNVQVKV